MSHILIAIILIINFVVLAI